MKTLSIIMAILVIATCSVAQLPKLRPTALQGCRPDESSLSVKKPGAHLGIPFRIVIANTGVDVVMRCGYCEVPNGVRSKRLNVLHEYGTVTWQIQARNHHSGV